MEKQRQCRHGRDRNELERVELGTNRFSRYNTTRGRNARNSRISGILEIYICIYIYIARLRGKILISPFIFSILQPPILSFLMILPSIEDYISLELGMEITRNIYINIYVDIRCFIL